MESVALRWGKENLLVTVSVFFAVPDICGRSRRSVFLSPISHLSIMVQYSFNYGFALQ